MPNRDESYRGPRSILHLIPVLAGGGAERQLEMLVMEQVRRGIDVHVALRRSGMEAERLANKGVNIHVLGDHRAMSPLLTIQIFRLVRRIKPMLLQTWLPQMDVHGGAVAKLSATPWILSERSSRRAFEGREWWSGVRRWLGRKADAIVANSVGGQSYWQSQFGFRSTLEVIPNAVDIAAIRSSFDSESAMSDPDGDVILSVGRLGPEKDFDVMIEALESIAHRCAVNLLIIGDGSLREELQSKIDKADLSGRIRLLGFQSRWWPRLKSARAIVSMSRFEGHPNVVIEAMVGGCPLIVSDIPAHREFLDESCAILTPVGDAAALSQRIVDLLADPEAAARRARTAARRVESLTIERAANGYDSVYQRLLSGAGN
jgi:glycosyltransferase involved in cell wall biosynthesis